MWHFLCSVIRQGKPVGWHPLLGVSHPPDKQVNPAWWAASPQLCPQLKQRERAVHVTLMLSVLLSYFRSMFLLNNQTRQPPTPVVELKPSCERAEDPFRQGWVPGLCRLLGLRMWSRARDSCPGGTKGLAGGGTLGGPDLLT